MATEEDTEVEEAETGQTIRRMPPDVEVGPFFPSGMSAPEAAMAGATNGMPDEEIEKIEALKAEYRIEESVE